MRRVIGFLTAIQFGTIAPQRAPGASGSPRERSVDLLEAYVLLGQIMAPAADATARARLRARIEAQKVAWRDVLTLASDHLVTPALYSRLCEKGLLEVLDDELRAYLATIADLNRERNRHIRSQLLEIIDELNGNGIEPVLLKGAAHLTLNLYSDSAERVLGDIDVLVPRERLNDAVTMLLAGGYADAVACFANDHHHYVPLTRGDRVVSVELHIDLVPRFYRGALSTAAVWRNSRRLDLEGRHVAVPCPEDLIVHNIVHSQLVNRGYWLAELSLRDAWDFILLCRYFGHELNWNRLTHRLAVDVGRSRSGFYVQCASRLFQSPLVPALPPTLGAQLAERRWRAHARGRLLPLKEAARLFAYVLKSTKQAEAYWHRGKVP